MEASSRLKTKRKLNDERRSEMDLKLKIAMEDETVRFVYLQNGVQETVAIARMPVKIEIWDKESGYGAIQGNYQKTEKKGDGYICTALLKNPDPEMDIFVTDYWETASSNVMKMTRKVVVAHGEGGMGIRTGMDLEILPEIKPTFMQMQYFAPPAIYDKNDLDEDGIDDYFLTQSRIIRDDRLNTLAFMAYHPESKKSLTVVRADMPEFDEYPERPNGETVFLQRTDVGSMGIWNGEQGLEFRLRYPFYEGPTSLALYSKEKVPWEAFWPALTGESFEVSYEIRVKSEVTFIDAMRHMYMGRLEELKPVKAELPASAERLARYRTYALDQYYMEKSYAEDRNEPAGYVLNCHPQDGKQLCDIIQYGFTGQNTVSAYCSLRQGYSDGDSGLIEHGLKTLDFFADRIHIPESGTFYNLYNMEKAQFDFWWTGLILPLSYAEGNRLRELMGPLYDYYKDILPVLKEKKGSYLRCMNEEAYGLISAYDFEKKIGRIHANWLETSVRYGDFLVRVQAEDGTWFRAYEITGEPITEPEIWFGKTYYEKKGCTSTSIPFLLELYRQTNDSKYLDAAIKAGKYVAEVSIEKIRCCGGIHDSIFEKGVLVDNESMLYAMLAMNELYKATGSEYYLNAAKRGAVQFASWIYLWDIPLPKNSTLFKYGFRTTGIGSCDVPSAGYVHTFENRGVAALVELAFSLQDENLLKIAELTWHGCNQTVSVPGRDWGYSMYGLQEEGWLVNWFMADDPVFNDNAGFGHRWKGEGNKTCYPWISAVALISYWNMKDRFGTADFTELKKQYQMKTK